MKLSIVIPVFNEQKTIFDILEKVDNAPIPREITEKELIIVDDCSTDGTRNFLNNINKSNIKVLFHDRNKGKGAALRTGFKNCTGDIVLIQDADLEYDPNEYSRLLRPILDGEADVVYGSRFMGGNPHRVLYFWHMVANRFLTLISNVFSDLNLTDMETCYKVFKKEVLEKIEIEENRFGFEPEITAKIGELTKENNIAIYEVGISYYGRTYGEGKKIGLKDAFRALWCIFKYNTSTLTHFIKYGLNGILVFISQYLTIISLVELFGFRSIVEQNIAHALSIEVSIIVGFVLHSFLGWRYKYKSLLHITSKCIQFHIITGVSVAIRIALFYVLSLTGMNYKLNTLIGIAVAIVWNFLGYDRVVFKKTCEKIMG